MRAAKRAPAVTTNGQILLSVQGVTKRWGNFSALKGVSFNLRAGEIHALFGANGAGKSTLARIISGHLSATEGLVSLRGRPVKFQRPRDAMEAGVGIVTQETSLADDIPVWENIILPMYGAKKRCSRAEMRKIASDALAKLGFLAEIDLDKPCGELSSAHRQLVEIARTVALESKVIVFDEPTAALSPSETTRLFKVMDALRTEGHGLIFVSHRLEEIFSMTDRITVLRDGHSVSNNLETASLTQAELIHHMVGKEVASLQAETVPDTSANPVVLKLNAVASAPLVKAASLQVHAGEIVGLGGLVGAGRSELVEMLMGSRAKTGGAVELLGKPYEPESPKAAIAAGLGFLPEDRRRQSIIPDFSVRENILLSHLSQLRGPSLQYGSRSDRINELADQIELARDRIDDDSLLNFSGGMQQKALIIRALMMRPKVLLLDEPTKGVDIGSRATIYSMLRKLAAEGMGILLISSDFEELLALSHRIVPISDGRTIGSVPAAELNEEQLTLICAPRTSLDQQNQLLAEASKLLDMQAAWVIQAGSNALFLLRQGQADGVSMPEPGSIARKEGSVIANALLGDRGEVFAEKSGSSSLMFIVENQRGIGLGAIALMSSPNVPPVDKGLVRRELGRLLEKLGDGHMRLRNTAVETWKVSRGNQ